MAKRPCLDCGALTDSTRCQACRSQQHRHRDHKRGNTTARGYGHRHQELREQWRPTVEAGLIDCARCGQPIRPGDPWDLGHTDDRTGYTGPECRTCNRSAGGRQA